MEASERRKPGPKCLPKSRLLASVTVKLKPDTILWLNQMFPGQVGPHIRKLVERDERNRRRAQSKGEAQ